MTTGADALAKLRHCFRTIPEEYEDAKEYKNGGLHPVETGHYWNIQGQKYLIVRKLGHGNVSTVWLCALCEKDTGYVKHPHQYVAIKVKMAKTPTIDQEWPMLIRLMHLMPRYVVVPSEGFHFHGPNGRHDAYIFKDIGASLSHIPLRHLVRSKLKCEQVYRYPLQVAKSIVKQVLEGLKEIHSVGIVHNDITFENVLVVAENVNHSPIEDIKTKPEDYESLDGVYLRSKRRPSCLCGPGNLVDDMAITLTRESSFKIMDFSHAWHIRNPSPTMTDKLGLLPPEQLLWHINRGDLLEFGPALDIWSVGVLAYEVVTGAVMFLTEEGFNPDATATAELGPSQLIDYLLLCIFNIFGTLPDMVISRWKNYDRYFDKNGVYYSSNLFHGPAARHYDFEPLETMIADHRQSCRLHGTEDMDDEEAELFMSFLKAAMVIDPAGRPSAEELSDHAWLKDYHLEPDVAAVPLRPEPVPSQPDDEVPAGVENENPRDKERSKAKAEPEPKPKLKRANAMAFDSLSPTDTSELNEDLYAHYARRKFEEDTRKALNERFMRFEGAHPYRHGIDPKIVPVHEGDESGASPAPEDRHDEDQPSDAGPAPKDKDDSKRRTV